MVGVETLLHSVVVKPRAEGLNGWLMRTCRYTFRHRHCVARPADAPVVETEAAAL